MAAGIFAIDITNALARALREEVDRAVTEATQKAVAEVQERLRNKVGEIATRLASEYHVERQGNVVSIHVKLTQP